MDGRRETDWQRPGFWLSVMSFVLTIVLVVLSFIWGKLNSIESNQQATSLTSLGQSKDIASQKEKHDKLQKDFDEYKTQQDIKDTWNQSTREKVIVIGTKLEDYGVLKPGDLPKK